MALVLLSLSVGELVAGLAVHHANLPRKGPIALITPDPDNEIFSIEYQQMRANASNQTPTTAPA